MLLNTTEDYFNKVAVEHFSDEEFFVKCTLIFEVLSHVGYVPFDIMVTQKEAKA